MNLLVLGQSTALAYGIEEHQSHPRVLQTLLRESFPGVPVDVAVRGWGPFSEYRLDVLMADVDRRRPDYLILETTYAWVTVPLVLSPNRTSLGQMSGTMGRLYKLQTAADRRLLGLGSSWWYSLYRRLYFDPVRSLGHRLFGSTPLYRVPDALAYLDQVIRVAKQRENMELLVLGPKPQAINPFWAPKNPKFREQAMAYFVGLKRLCAEHRVTLVDVNSMLDPRREEGLILSDDLHPSPKAHALVAQALHAAILASERPYRTADPDFAH